MVVRDTRTGELGQVRFDGWWMVFVPNRTMMPRVIERADRYRDARSGRPVVRPR